MVQVCFFFCRVFPFFFKESFVVSQSSLKVVGSFSRWSRHDMTVFMGVDVQLLIPLKEKVAWFENSQNMSDPHPLQQPQDASTQDETSSPEESTKPFRPCQGQWFVGEAVNMAVHVNFN